MARVEPSSPLVDAAVVDKTASPSHDCESQRLGSNLSGSFQYNSELCSVKNEIYKKVPFGTRKSWIFVSASSTLLILELHGLERKITFAYCVFLQVARLSWTHVTCYAGRTAFNAVGPSVRNVNRHHTVGTFADGSAIHSRLILNTSAQVAFASHRGNAATTGRTRMLSFNTALKYFRAGKSSYSTFRRAIPRLSRSLCSCISL